jgi:hypothetical protein
MVKRSTTTEMRSIEQSLQTALTPVRPSRELLERLQDRVKGLAPAARPLPTRAEDPLRPNLTFLGLAGVFTLLMTLAVGFRTAGSIVGGLTLLSELNRQMKARKIERLTPTG